MSQLIPIIFIHGLFDTSHSCITFFCSSTFYFLQNFIPPKFSKIHILLLTGGRMPCAGDSTEQICKELEQWNWSQKEEKVHFISSQRTWHLTAVKVGKWIIKALWEDNVMSVFKIGYLCKQNMLWTSFRKSMTPQRSQLIVGPLVQATWWGGVKSNGPLIKKKQSSLLHRRNAILDGCSCRLRHTDTQARAGTSRLCPH